MSDAPAAVAAPDARLHLDDFAAGQVVALGELTVSREEIIAFAKAYDPQPFHVDAAAAERSIYGGLIASGWHTACLFMRLFVAGLMGRTAGMGSPGVDELRWLQPVRPGDVLRGRVEVLEVRPSRSRPDRGMIRFLCLLTNPGGAEVLRLTANVMVARRHLPESAA